MIFWHITTCLVMVAGLIALPLVVKWSIENDCAPAGIFCGLLFLAGIGAFALEVHATVELINAIQDGTKELNHV